MIIVSQNAVNYDIPLPDHCIFRINLAWCDSLEQLQKILDDHKNNEIFMDLPIGRIKPPNNKYNLKELIPILESNKQIKYFAVSNVESSNDLVELIKSIPKDVIIVPKIESPNAIKNLKDIVDSLDYKQKYLMLDHDDLYSAILKNNEGQETFLQHIERLVNFCDEEKISLLRTVGVIFSDSEKRISQYVK